MTSSKKPRTPPNHDVIDQTPQIQSSNFFNSKLVDLPSFQRVWTAL